MNAPALYTLLKRTASVMVGDHAEHRLVIAYRSYSKLRTRTALGSYGRAVPRGLGTP